MYPSWPLQMKITRISNQRVLGGFGGAVCPLVIQIKEDSGMYAAGPIAKVLRGLLSAFGGATAGQIPTLLRVSDDRRFTSLHVCGACGVTWWTCFADRNSLQRPSWCCPAP